MEQPSTPRFIWIDSHGRGRNVYALFRRSITLSRLPQRARLHIFADTRYRLFANGRVIGHGPARFYRHAPTYDSYDLANLLKVGVNAVGVVVNSYGAPCFHAEPSTGGLVVWLDGDEDLKRLASDGNWRCIRSPMHEPSTRRLTFALNPGEEVDLRREPLGWQATTFDDSTWPKAVELDPRIALGTLTPRPLAMPITRSRVAVSPPGRFEFSPCEPMLIYSARLEATPPRPAMNYYEMGVWLKLQSPRAQRIRVSTSPCRLWSALGEQQGRVERKLDDHHRRVFDVDVQVGEQVLFAWTSLAGEVWDFAVGVPPDSGVTVASAECTLPMHVSRAEEIGRPSGIPSIEDAQCVYGHVAPLSLQRGHVSPARDRAWQNARPTGEDEAVSGVGSVGYLYDFGDEYHGRVSLKFRARAGTMVDVAYTERVDSTGVAVLHDRAFVDMVERVIARDGAQSWLAFHPRGGRYVEVRVTGDVSDLRIEQMQIIDSLYPLAPEVQVRTGDAMLDAIWLLGRKAFDVAVEDAYLDCPARERCPYVGDSLVQLEIAAELGADLRPAARTFELFIHGQGVNGLIRPGAHGLEPGRHPDYSAQMFMFARRLVELTNDSVSVARHASALKRLGESLMSYRRDHDVYDFSELKPYIDIARHRSREPFGLAMNAFLARGFSDAAWLFGKFGEPRTSDMFAAEARRLVEAIRRTYWDELRGVYLDLPKQTGGDQTPSGNGNVLAWLFGIATDDQRQSVAKFVLDCAANNFFDAEMPARRDAQHFNAFFSFFLLQALAEAGRFQEALSYIRRCWGPMVRAGAWCTWESFGGDPTGSLSHVWSASPTWFLLRYWNECGFPMRSSR